MVERSFYDTDSVKVAPRLLNKILARRGPAGEILVSGRIVEVEAYRGDKDAASHAFKGETKRNAVMFGPPGKMYVYFTYGMHWCANLVCQPEGTAEAVLLRALAPMVGLDLIRSRRGASLPERDLMSGPARLCQGLDITRADDGADVVDGDLGLVVLDDGTPPPRRPGRSARVGIRLATEFRWRWFVEGDPNVSRGRPGEPGRQAASGGQTGRQRHRPDMATPGVR